jgi:hypothetical protein
MTSRTAARAAWSLWGLSLALAAGGVLVGVYGGAYRRSGQIPAVLGDLHKSMRDDLSFAVWILTFTTLGALVAARRWRNPVGWLLLAEGLAWDVQLVGEDYAAALFTRPGALPGGELALWVIDWWLYIAAYLLLFFLLLLLPTGRLPSRRWRWAGWLGVGCVVLIVPSLLARRPLRPELPAITNTRSGCCRPAPCSTSWITSPRTCCCRCSGSPRWRRWCCAFAPRAALNASSSSGWPTRPCWCSRSWSPATLPGSLGRPATW